MLKMKEIKTPFKFFGIRYFKDEQGLYYKKVGGNHRKQTRPFWKMKRIRLGIPLVFILILGFIGYRIGMNIASDKVVTELSSQIPEKDIQELLKDPGIQQLIENEIGPNKKQEVLEKYSVASTTLNGKYTAAVNKGNQGSSIESKVNQQTPNKSNSKLNFKTREDVLKFLLSKFTMGELTELAKKTDGGLTFEEKTEIKNIVLARLSKEEYDAVKVFAIIELSKQ